MVASIHYLLNKLKKRLFETFLVIKSIEKSEKTCSFMFMNKGISSVTFSLTTHLGLNEFKWAKSFVNKLGLGFL